MMNTRSYIGAGVLASSLAIGAASLFAVPAVAATETQATDYREQLLERLTELETLSASFVQQVIDDRGQLVQQQHGVLSLKRPNFLRWQTDAPDETLLIANGETLWYYNAFIEQVTIYDQNDAVAQSPLLLLLDGDNNSWDQYVVTQVEVDEMAPSVPQTPDIKANTTVAYRVTPTDAADDQQELTLGFAKGAVISRITLDDGQGQISDIILADQVLNAAIADTEFAFELPEGIEVDDQRSGRN